MCADISNTGRLKSWSLSKNAGKVVWGSQPCMKYTTVPGTTGTWGQVQGIACGSNFSVFQYMSTRNRLTATLSFSVFNGDLLCRLQVPGHVLMCTGMWPRMGDADRR